MFKAYKFRLYPTIKQQSLLAKQAGSCRWLWNYFLELNNLEYKNNKKFIFANKLITSLPILKQEKEWLNETFSQSLQQVARHFDKALKDFLNPKLKKDFPVFKKKSNMNDGFTVPQVFRIKKNYVFIPKIGEVKWIKHCPIKGKVKHITIKQDGNQWFCSVCVNLKTKNLTTKINLDKVVGIDVGLKTYATMSDGSKIENPKILKKYEKKLKRENRRLSRKKKDSKNRIKQRLKVSKLHRKIKNIRKDFQHKTTHDMITKYDGFIMEDLNIEGMMKNHCLSKAIADVGWYEFKRQLKYKSEWKGKKVVEIGRFEPSSKTCSDCGWINKDLELNDREFVCKECGITLDRDLNAAINIKKMGMKTVGWDTSEQENRILKTTVETRGSLFLTEQGACRRSSKKNGLGLNKQDILN